MSIISRISNRLHTDGLNTLDPTHLSLRHKHMAVIFKKGTTFIMGSGKNHKSCSLRGSKEREQENCTRRKGRRKGLSDCSRGSFMYRQLPIKISDNSPRIKTLYTRNSNKQRNWRVKTFKAMYRL